MRRQFIWDVRLGGEFLDSSKNGSAAVFSTRSTKREYNLGSPINDVNVLREDRVQGFCDDGTKAIVIKCGTKGGEGDVIYGRPFLTVPSVVVTS